MTDREASPVEHHDDDELVSNYRPPQEKSLKEILDADKHDESLRKYKEALLGANAHDIIIDANDPRKVLVKRLALVVEGRKDMELDLTRDMHELKKTSFVIKEAIQYKVRIDFMVQREIVTGLKYVQRTYRKGIQVDKINQMVGSYAPKTEMQSYITPLEDAPHGLLARGSYTVKSLFTDDDKHEHLKWEWCFEIKKDWDV